MGVHYRKRTPLLQSAAFIPFELKKLQVSIATILRTVRKYRPESRLRIHSVSAFFTRPLTLSNSLSAAIDQRVSLEDLLSLGKDEHQ